jgi:prepilin-type N-terminal cleavage/methylation domain-containing protein
VTRRGERAGEGGMTLIELLVTITIMGIVFTVFLGGVGLAIRASDQHRRTVDAETVLRNAAEELQRAGYAPCASPPYTLTDDPLDTFVVEAPVLKGYLASPGATQFSDPDTDPCTSDTGGAQLIELKVVSEPSSPRPVREQTLQVVKRDNRNG